MATACYNPEKVYLPAVFKGVQFKAEEAGSEHGRRGAEGEFPWGEFTAYADMGRRIRTFTINAYFDDNTHVSDSQALIDACESVGPGLLIHPTRGPVTVACRSCRVSDQMERESGVTSIQLDFVEAEEMGNVFGTANIGPMNITGFVNSISDFFLSVYNPPGVIFYEKNNLIQSAATAVATLSNGYASTSNPQQSILSDYVAIENDPYIVSDPKTAITVFKNSFNLIDNESSGREKANIYRNIESHKTGEFSVDATITLLSAGYYAKALLEYTPATINEGMAQYADVVRMLDGVINECDFPEMYLALRAFRIEAEQALLQRAFSLPALVVYDFAGTVHSVVAAYEIYDDALRYREIESQNEGFPWSLGPEIVAGET